MKNNEIDKHASKPRAEVRRMDYEISDPAEIKSCWRREISAYWRPPTRTSLMPPR